MWQTLLLTFHLCLLTDPVAFRLEKQAGSGKMQVEASPLSTEAVARLRSVSENERATLLRQTLRLYVVNPQGAIDEKQSGMSGTITLQDRKLVFDPNFPLVAGLTYEAIYVEPGDSAKLQRGRLTVPKKEPAPRVQVAAIYPSSEVVPQNLLRIYLQFTAPVAQGDVYRYIELSGADGKKLEFPFLELAEELWDPTGTRLTLLLDPARIKQGLVPREEDGPILESGKEYRLTIRSDWPDVDGNPLLKGEVRKLRVADQDTVQPKPEDWQLELPKIGSREPLGIVFPEPLDQALALRCITILDSKGEPVAGTRKLSDRETRWSLLPTEAWGRGTYQIRVETILEDVAGNSVGRPFEVDLAKQSEASAVAPTAPTPKPQDSYVLRRFSLERTN